MGVWIETSIDKKIAPESSVTPYVGVWIETVQDYRIDPVSLSLLMWECGLKP